MNSGLLQGFHCAVTIDISNKVAVAVISAVMMWVKLHYAR
jgi:hypothetical protein